LLHSIVSVSFISLTVGITTTTTTTITTIRKPTWHVQSQKESNRQQLPVISGMLLPYSSS
jgi:hypothetical protein